MFTCPPYGDKEKWNERNDPVEKSCDEWIRECMRRFDCEKYLFVVDETECFKDDIVEEIDNSSHLGKGKEYAVLIKKKMSIHKVCSYITSLFSMQRSAGDTPR